MATSSAQASRIASPKSESLRYQLAQTDANLALTELEWDSDVQAYKTLANDIRHGFECHIRQPFDWEQVSKTFAELLADGESQLVNRYIERCLKLCELFSEVAESIQTIMLYAMVGGGSQVLDFPWHVDRVSLSMVDTVTGPGTLWVADQDVHRDLFSNTYIPDINGPSPIKPDAVIHEAPNGTVAIFKGELRRDHDYPAVQAAIKDNQDREFNRGKGLVHASPILPEGEKRLFFCAMTFAVPSYLRDLES